MGTVNLKDWFDSTYGGGTGLGFWNREDYSTPNNVPAWDALSPDQKLEFLKTGGISSLGFQDKAPNWAGAFDNRTPEQVLASGNVNFADPQGNEGIGGMLKTLGVFAGAAGLGGLMGGGFGGLSGVDVPWGVNPASGSDTVSFTGSIPGGSSNMQSLWQAAQPGATATGAGNMAFDQFGDGFGIDYAGGPTSGTTTFFPQGFNLPGDFWPSSMGTASNAASAAKSLFGGNTDWASLLGKLGSAGVSYLGNQNLSSALTNIANQGRNDRAPFLEAAKTAMNDPNAWAQTGPAQQLFKQQWAQLSPVFGNPAGAPAAQGIAADAGLRGWQNYVTGMGNLGLGNQANTQNLQAQAAQAANDTAPFGAAIQAATAPAQPDWMKLFGLKGFA